MPHAVTITGSRRTRHRHTDEYDRLFSSYLQPFAGLDSHVYVGGALGIDTLALSWLMERSPAALTVVVPCTLSDQPDEARQLVDTAHKAHRVSLVELDAPQLDEDAYNARNRWMVDRSDFVIGFPHGDDPRSGTWYTIRHGAEQAKARLIVPI